MANAAPFDLTTSDATFAATYAQLLGSLKRNYDSAGNLMGALDHALAIRFDLAERQNLIDDFILAVRPRVRWLNFGDGSPEGSVVADTGAIYFNTDPGDGYPLWTKTEDNGLATGWSAVTTSANGQSVALLGHAARSIVGRAANSSGAAADIAGGGANTVLVDNGTTLAFSTISVATLADETILDIDAANEATSDWNALGDGNRSFGGLTWVTANVATGANVFGPVNATGLRFNAFAASRTYTTGTRTASYLRIPITTAIPNFDPLGTYVLEAYFSSLTLGTLNRVLLALDLDVAGTDRMLGGGRRNTSGDQQVYSTIDASGTVIGDSSTADCVAVRINAHGVATFGGDSSGGNFPARYTKSGGVMQAVDSYCSVMDPASFIVIAFLTLEVGGNMDATLRRFRIRRIRG